MERKKIIGIVSLIVIILLAIMAFFNFTGYHSTEIGSTHSTVPTEVPVPPAEPQKDI